MLKCKDIAAQSSDYIDKQLNFKTRLEFYLHLLMCGLCRRYIHNFKLMVKRSPDLKQKNIADIEAEKILAHVKKQAAKKPDSHH